jgi:hypothetical protein
MRRVPGPRVTVWGRRRTACCRRSRGRLRATGGGWTHDARERRCGRWRSGRPDVTCLYSCRGEGMASGSGGLVISNNNNASRQISDPISRSPLSANHASLGHSSESQFPPFPALPFPSLSFCFQAGAVYSSGRLLPFALDNTHPRFATPYHHT